MAPIANLLIGIAGTGKSTTANYLNETLEVYGYNPELIRFDSFRKTVTPAGADPFSADPSIKNVIYNTATDYFLRRMNAGRSLIIDAGLTSEAILRLRIKSSVPNLRIVYLTAPLWRAMLRETLRSCRSTPHERGRFLYARSIGDRLNPFLAPGKKFPQPPITYPFEAPTASADLVIDTSHMAPRAVAELIIAKLGITNLAQKWHPPVSA